MSEPDLVVDARVTVSGKCLSWTSARSSGPGGQNVNKVESKIDLRYAFETDEALSPVDRDRIRAHCKSRIDAEGALQVVSQKTRDRSQNLEDARQKLVAMLKPALAPRVVRKKTKPSKGAVRRRLSDKSAQGQKKAQRKVRHDD